MKRLALLCLAAMMLAATVFAPAAIAATGDVEIQSVRLGTGGTAVVTATIECTQGMYYQVYTEARQTTGNRPYNVGGGQYPASGNLATCPTSGQDTFTTTVVGERPFKKGNILVRTQALVCDPYCEYRPQSDFVELRVS